MKKKRRLLKDEANKSSRWAVAYANAEKTDTKRVTRQISRDLKKHNSISDKTKRKMQTNAILSNDRKHASLYNESKIKALEKHTQEMINKYGDQNVRKTNVRTLKNGEKFVNKLFSSDDAVYSVEKSRRVDLNGNKYEVYVPVRTYYQYR